MRQLCGLNTVIRGERQVFRGFGVLGPVDSRVRGNDDGGANNEWGAVSGAYLILHTVILGERRGSRGFGVFGDYGFPRTRE